MRRVYALVRTREPGLGGPYTVFVRKLRKALGRENVAGAYGYGYGVEEACFVRGADEDRVIELLGHEWLKKTSTVVLPAVEWLTRSSAKAAFRRHLAKERKKSWASTTTRSWRSGTSSPWAS